MTHLLPEIHLKPNDMGSDWEVQLGYIDHLIMEGKYEDAMKEIKECGTSSEISALFVMYFGLYCSTKNDRQFEAAKYAAFIQHHLYK